MERRDGDIFLYLIRGGHDKFVNFRWTFRRSGSPSADLSSLPTEASLIGRFVAILTPVFAIAAGWIAGLVAQAVPGAHLDQDQIVTFMAAGWKWLHGWQQHEALVARGLDVPVKQGRSPQAALAAGTLPAPAAPSVSSASSVTPEGQPATR